MPILSQSAGRTGLEGRVVITGIGAVSPNGIGREAFWQATKCGASGIRRITRFDPSGYLSQVAGEVTGFNEEQWVPYKDRPHVSRVVPLAVAAASEALDDAGVETRTMSRDGLRRIGVMLGSGGGALEFTEQQYRLWHEGKWRQCSVYVVPSSTPGTLASEISMRFGFRGLSHLVSTGCASSTDAIAYGVRHVQSGTVDMVLAGGADAPIAPLILRGFIGMRALSTSWNEQPDRASRPFSRDRDGFVIGEGAWFFVLEGLDYARARGARIYAEVAGYGSTCEAFHRVRMEESGEEPARAIAMAMEGARVPPEAVQYIAYHGTATDLNDRIETRAVKTAFGRHAYRLAGSSIKSMIGHPQGACGAAGIAATLMAIRDGTIPPTVNVDEPDPECDLDYVRDKGRVGHIEYAVANCIAFGSKNSALVLRNLG